MPTKTILSPAQRAVIFDPPADRATIERLYTLGPDDLAQVARRRRGANRLGYAVQLCYLRHPGRRLLTGDAVPAAMLALLADQIGCVANDFTGYATRPTTLREHRAEIEALLGLRAFARVDVRAMLALGSEIAASTDSGQDIERAQIYAKRLCAHLWVDSMRRRLQHSKGIHRTVVASPLVAEPAYRQRRDSVVRHLRKYCLGNTFQHEAVSIRDMAKDFG